jgi:hypothetical protein
MSAARHAAIMEHWARFRVDPPLSILVAPEDEPALIRAVVQAVARGQPLTLAEVLAIARVKDPGPDPNPEWPRCT